MFGPIPDGTGVLHHCDNRRCVNPDHLFLGTAADNAADMVSKCRQNRGTKHPRAKLSDQDVLDIRGRLQAGALGIDLAAEYHVTAAMISCVRLRKNWTHI